MDTPALTALLPVVILIVLGVVAAKLDWIRAGAVKDLSQLVFYILTPALLFRTMASVRLGDLDFQPIALYFLAVALILRPPCCSRDSTPWLRPVPWPTHSAIT